MSVVGPSHQDSHIKSQKCNSFSIRTTLLYAKEHLGWNLAKENNKLRTIKGSSQKFDIIIFGFKKTSNCDILKSTNYILYGIISNQSIVKDKALKWSLI